VGWHVIAIMASVGLTSSDKGTSVCVKGE